MTNQHTIHNDYYDHCLGCDASNNIGNTQSVTFKHTLILVEVKKHSVFDGHRLAAKLSFPLYCFNRTDYSIVQFLWLHTWVNLVVMVLYDVRCPSRMIPLWLNQLKKIYKRIRMRKFRVIGYYYSLVVIFAWGECK